MSCSPISCLWTAASETTVAAALTFVLAMLKYPDVQKKAQREIDSVVGLNRLPAFSDKSCLPYLAAVLKEVLRFVIFSFRSSLAYISYPIPTAGTPLFPSVRHTL